MPQQEISSEEMFGISKRINKELEVLPLHTHLAIIQMVKVGSEHRNKAMEFAHMTQQNDQQERIIRLKEYEMQQAQKASPPLTPPN